jgi:hypothetical protein
VKTLTRPPVPGSPSPPARGGDPSTASDEEVRAAALAWAQEFSDVTELPKGERMMGAECPLAIATGMIVDGDTGWTRERGMVGLPPLVAEFTNDLDRQGE